MVFDVVNGVVATLNSAANRIRSAIGEAAGLHEQRANTAMYSISELLEKLASMLRMAKCIAEKIGAEEPIASLCTTWRLMVSDGKPMLVRVKPATTIAYRDGAIVFQRGDVRLELAGNMVKLCKWNYCKELDPARRDKVLEILPQLFYLLREVGLYVNKSYEALRLCAKQQYSDCLG